MRIKTNKYVVSGVIQKHGHTYLQWSLAFLGASVLVTVGFLIGWVSPMKAILLSDESPTGSPLTSGEISAIASTLSLTAIIGVPFCTYIGEEYGRKKAILIIIMLQALCWVLKLVAKSGIVIIIARASAGIGYGGTYILIPMYIREISQEDIKGLLGTLILSTQHLGVLGMYVMGSYLSYNATLWSVLAFTIVTFVLMLLIPESPAFLIKYGKIEKATDIVATLRGLRADDTVVQTEIKCMKDEDDYFKTAKLVSLKAIIKNKAWFRGIMLGQLMGCSQALNGTFGIVTYALSIIEQAGISFNPELQSLLIPILLALGTILPLSFVEKAGRKPLLVGAFGTCGVAMCGLASALLAQSYGVAVPGWTFLLCIAVDVTAYSAGVIPMPTIILIDILRFHVRARILTPIFMVTLAMISVYLAAFDPISNAFGLYTVFFISSAINLLCAVITLVWLPETKGRTVEEIEAILVGEDKKHVFEANQADHPGKV